MKFVAEVRAGLREGSVVTIPDVAETLESTGVWEQLRRELEDVGISPTAIEENREHIQNWFKATLQSGLLEEDAVGAARPLPPSSSSPSSSSYRLLGLVGSSSRKGSGTGRGDGVGGDGRDNKKAAVLVGGGVPPPPPPLSPSPPPPSDSGYGGSERMNSVVSSMMSANEGFEEDLRRNNQDNKLLEESFGGLSVTKSFPAVPAMKKASPTRLLLKFLKKDDAIIQAASDGRIDKVAKLISLGVNINARDRWG